MEMKDLLEKTKVTYSGSGYFWAEKPEDNKSHELFIYPLADGKIKRSYESSLDPIPQRFNKVLLGIYSLLVWFFLIKFGIVYGLLASLPLIVGAIHVKKTTSKKALFKAIDEDEIVVLIAKKDTKQAKLIRKIEEVQRQLDELKKSATYSKHDLFSDYVTIKLQVNSFVRSASNVLKIAMERNIDGDPTATLEMIREADTIVNQLIELRKADAEKDLAIATQSKVKVEIQPMIDDLKSQTSAIRAIGSGLDN